MKTFILFLIAIGISLMLNSCTNSGSTAPDTDDSPVAKGQSAVQDPLSQPNILQVAIGSKDHSTLVAGVQAASLEDVLSNAGPLTVFAPNNDAFAKLPAGTWTTSSNPRINLHWRVSLNFMPLPDPTP